MRISHIYLCGFRGFKNLVQINFAPGFNIISGRNGVGKSTICDAIEFALTGTIDKYNDAKSGNETIQDYIWWRTAEKARTHTDLG